VNRKNTAASEGEQRYDVEHQRMPHERDVAPDFEKFHALAP
jgi:hypothetical protein